MKEISTRKILLTSFVVDFVDIVINLVVALLTNSIVMTAETLQGMADLIATGFLLVGLKRSAQPASSLYPFGRGRELYFWTLLSSILMLFLTASLSFYLGLQRFLHPAHIDNLGLALIVLFVAVLTNGYSLSLGIRRILAGSHHRHFLKLFSQSSFIEIKTTIVLDLMGTASALWGLASLWIYKVTGKVAFDGVGAMGIGLTLAVLSTLLITEIRQFLIGKRASREVERQIREIVMEFAEVNEVTEIKTVHNSSDQILVNLDVHLHNNLDTDKIEKLINDIKKAVKSKIPEVSDLQIELHN